MTDSWVITVEFPDKTKGCIVGDEGGNRIFHSEAEAEREKKRLLRNKGYSWTGCTVRVEKLREAWK